MKTPTIRPCNGKSTEFHDSSLIDFQAGPDLTSVTVVVSTPDEFGVQHLWEVAFQGVLRLEFETVGTGEEDKLHPPEIYDISDHPESAEYMRWKQRLVDIDEDEKKLHHIVLASGFICGWGERNSLEGISIICRSFQVRPADRKYRGQEFSRPVIPGAPEEAQGE
jgi:hypothetical protein